MNKSLKTSQPKNQIHKLLKLWRDLEMNFEGEDHAFKFHLQF